MTAFRLLLSCLLLHVATGQIYLPCDDYEFTTEDSCSCYNPDSPIISCPSARLMSIPNITKAHILQLNNNSLSSLRANELSHLGGLKKLEITDNRINDVSVNAFNGVELTLEWLDLRRNRLGAIPSVFGMDNSSINPQMHGAQMLMKLTILKLSNNYINSINNKAFNGVPSLRQIYLDGNPINRIAPDGWMGPPSLSYLALTVSNMDITMIPTDNLQLLTSLHVLGAKPMRLDFFSAWFEAFPLLQYLKLEYMGLEDDHLSKGSFPTGLSTHLQGVSLRGNKLTTIPYRILSPLRLRELDLSRNMMRRIGHYHDLLQNLYNLNMEGNLIAWIHDDFLLSLHRVHVVDLRNNYMTGGYWGSKDIDENLPQQAVLLLGGNNWRCNCGEYWLKELVIRQVNTHNGHLSRDDIYSDLRCGPDPAIHSGKLIVDISPNAFCSRRRN